MALSVRINRGPPLPTARCSQGLIITPFRGVGGDARIKVVGVGGGGGNAVNRMIQSELSVSWRALPSWEARPTF
jgi:hypothetical protein